MHSSRMCTARSLTVSRGVCHARLLAMHASLATHAPCHACPPATHSPAMHAPLPHMPPLPCTPPCHACSPPCTAPHLPHMPPLPRMPPMWTENLTHATQNITLPQTSFAGGNKRGHHYCSKVQIHLEPFLVTFSHVILVA